MSTRTNSLGLAAGDPHLFHAHTHDAYRRASAHGTDVSTYWRQWMYDAERGRGTRRLTQVQALCDVFASCPNLADAVAWTEALRGYVLRVHAERFGFPHSVIETCRSETSWQARADVDQFGMLLNPTRARYEAALYTLGGHAEWIRLTKDAVQVQLGTKRPTLFLMPDTQIATTAARAD